MSVRDVYRDAIDRLDECERSTLNYAIVEQVLTSLDEQTAKALIVEAFRQVTENEVFA